MSNVDNHLSDIIKNKENLSNERFSLFKEYSCTYNITTMTKGT